MVFNVEHDPSESAPLTHLPAGLLRRLAELKRAYEAKLTPTHIDTVKINSFGMRSPIFKAPRAPRCQNDKLEILCL